MLITVKISVTERSFSTFLLMKYVIIILAFIVGVSSCDTTKSVVRGDSSTNEIDNDTVRIANDSLEYEIIIIEPGFNNWLITQPPMGYYGQSFLENRNIFLVSEYNRRVYNINFPRDLYIQEINYDPNIDYGLEVNYLLYNYFRYFQRTYNQNLGVGRR